MEYKVKTHCITVDLSNAESRNKGFSEVQAFTKTADIGVLGEHTSIDLADNSEQCWSLPRDACAVLRN